MSKLNHFYGSVKSELDKVIFPRSTEVKQSFFSVFLVVSVIAAFLSIIDLVMSSILQSVL